MYTSKDVKDECGVQIACLKTTIEGVSYIYNEFASDSWGFYLTDAANVFNNV